MRLIDADALLEDMQKFLLRQEKNAYMTGDREIRVTWDDAIYFIKNTRTIDIPEHAMKREMYGKEKED